MISLVLILPADQQETGDIVAIALGHDIEPGHTYSVPLSVDGNEPATHYGARTWTTPGFALMVEIAKSGVVPDGTATMLADMAMGVRTSYPDMVAALIADRRDTDEPYPHWTDVLASNGLQTIMPEPS